MITRIVKELKTHAPFTFLGALSGIVLFFFLKNVSGDWKYNLFYVFHPLHVFFSAFVTASLYKIFAKDFSIKKLILIGFIGSVGIGTLSDSLLPYLGEILLKLPHAHAHIGFIEKWYLVNPLAFLGIFLAAKLPSTKFPHMAHVLLSTWASLFHVMMALGETVSFSLYAMVLGILFISVWTPCCLSDIFFPLLFVKDEKIREELSCCSHGH